MNLKGQSTMPFSFRTELDITPANEELGKRIRSLSRLKYGQDARIVEASIFRRSCSWESFDSAEPQKNIVPSFVNFTALDLGYLALDAPGSIDALLQKSALLTIREIITCSKNNLIEEKGFSLREVQKLEKCLEPLGICLPEWDSLKKRKDSGNGKINVHFWEELEKDLASVSSAVQNLEKIVTIEEEVL
jgi:hypothetical protein